MKHDDFKSLELEAVLGRICDFSMEACHAKSVHWLSAFGLSRVQKSEDDNWQMAFATADVVSKHVFSVREQDWSDLFPVWRSVARHYSQPGRPDYKPHVLTAAGVAFAALPLVHEGSFLGILFFENLSQAEFEHFYKLWKASVQIAAKYVAFAYKHLEAKNLALIDELTGLHNQRYLPTVLEHEIERARRGGTQFSLLFMDIDYFKMVNDGRGHWVGSKLLGEMASILKTQVRTCDYAFRYGGDEFILLLASSSADNSARVAERIRKAVEEHVFFIEGQELRLTVSIGLAAYPEHAKNASELIQLADQAMYYGKRKSRNIVFVAS